MIKEDIVRQSLPKRSRLAFDDIVYQRSLGASNHINMIGEMIESIALEGKINNLSIDKIVDDILALSQFFIETRGEASQAIGNGINIMIKGINDVRSLEKEEALKCIINVKNNYLKKTQMVLEKIVNYGVRITEPMRTIMVFDYSSTVDKLLENIKIQEDTLTVIIPESRSINGGHAFVKTCLKAGHRVKFIPDAAIMYFLKKCDAAFMGAETFFPDGTVFNTTGSDIVGLVCKEFKIPLYILTPLIKVDIRSTYGYTKTIVKNDLKDRLSSNWKRDEKELTKFICPELLSVEAKYITAFITEQGIFPSYQLFNISTQYYEELRGGN